MSQGVMQSVRFDDSTGEPLFRQVANQLAEAIITGTYRDGDQIPSTTEISTTYRINPATVLKGMNLLVERGLLEKRRGLGMFVTTGGQRRAMESKRNEFLSEQVPHFVTEAKRLGFDVNELSAIIREEYQ